MTSCSSNPVELRSPSIRVERRSGLPRVQVNSIQAPLMETAENMPIPNPGYAGERAIPAYTLSRVPAKSPEHRTGHAIQYHAGHRRYRRMTIVERARQRSWRH